MSNVDDDFRDYYAKLEGQQSVMGMTLRDYFAAKALQGMNANRLYDDFEWDTLATHAYSQADAMLAARSA